MLDKKAILFDLDGTLLSMDQDEFIKKYFGLLAKTLVPLGFEPDKLIKTVWDGTKAMYGNDGLISNEDAFFNCFCKAYGEDATKYKPDFEKFYENEFNLVAASCKQNEDAIKLVKKLKGKYRLILATNPMFPRIATLNRIKWAGLDAEDFEIITTYEDYHSTKPNSKYYLEVLEKANLKPEECLMVGNDVDEDILPTKKINIDGFLVLNDLINKSNIDINGFNKGNFSDLERYILD